MSGLVHENPILDGSHPADLPLDFEQFLAGSAHLDGAVDLETMAMPWPGRHGLDDGDVPAQPFGYAFDGNSLANFACAPASDSNLAKDENIFSSGETLNIQGFMSAVAGGLDVNDSASPDSLMRQPSVTPFDDAPSFNTPRQTGESVSSTNHQNATTFPDFLHGGGSTFDDLNAAILLGGRLVQGQNQHTPAQAFAPNMSQQWNNSGHYQHYTFLPQQSPRMPTPTVPTYASPTSPIFPQTAQSGSPIYPRIPVRHQTEQEFQQQTNSISGIATTGTFSPLSGPPNIAQHGIQPPQGSYEGSPNWGAYHYTHTEAKPGVAPSRSHVRTFSHAHLDLSGDSSFNHAHKRHQSMSAHVNGTMSHNVPAWGMAGPNTQATPIAADGGHASMGNANMGNGSLLLRTNQTGSTPTEENVSPSVPDSNPDGLASDAGTPPQRRSSVPSSRRRNTRRKVLSEQEKRNNHNWSEKRRRIVVDVGFDGVKHLMPELFLEKNSRAEHINAIREYIMTIDAENEAIARRLGELNGLQASDFYQPPVADTKARISGTKGGAGNDDDAMFDDFDVVDGE